MKEKSLQMPLNYSTSISNKAIIGKNVIIGDYTIIHDNVIIGDNTIIGSHCNIGVPTKLAKGKPLIIEKNSHIRSHSIFYQGSTFGHGLITGHSILVRENTKAGEWLQIGTQTSIEGDCTIGHYVRILSEVQIAKASKIGDLVWLYPRVQFTNDPFPPSNICEGITAKDMAVIATGSILLPGVSVGMGSFVGAGSIVRSNVPDVHCVSGNPATIFARIDQFFSFKHNISYPWPKHFRHGYPEESYKLMDEIVDKINKKVKQLKESKKLHI